MGADSPEALGALLYGYTEEEAGEVRAFLEGLAGRYVEIFGGSGLEDRIVMDVVDGEAGGHFGARRTRVLMLLGFDDPGIEAVLSAFPVHLPRPIFCAPTESNMGWRLSELVRHLVEERERFARDISGR